MLYIQNTKKDSDTIAMQLRTTGQALFCFTDGEKMHLDILMSHKIDGIDTVSGGGEEAKVQRGIKNDYLFVSVMSHGSFGFKVKAGSSGSLAPEYVGEKLGFGRAENLITEPLAGLINKVISELLVLYDFLPPDLEKEMKNGWKEEQSAPTTISKMMSGLFDGGTAEIFSALKEFSNIEVVCFNRWGVGFLSPGRMNGGYKNGYFALTEPAKKRFPPSMFEYSHFNRYLDMIDKQVHWGITYGSKEIAHKDNKDNIELPFIFGFDVAHCDSNKKMSDRRECARHVYRLMEGIEIAIEEYDKRRILDGFEVEY